MNKFKRNKITSLDIIIFLRQLATLTKSGISIIDSLNLLEKSQDKKLLRLLLFQIKREIMSGKSLSTSLELTSTHFDKLTLHGIKLGEKTGNLDHLLTLLATHQENTYNLLKRIKATLFYPCIILTLGLVMTIFLLIFVIPRFAILFEGQDHQLPLLTLCLFKLSYFLKFFSLWFIGFICILPFVVKKLHVQQSYWQRIATLPLINTYVQKFLLARFARHLAITFAAGIPLLQALALLNDTTYSKEFNKAVLYLHTKVSTGLSLHESMSHGYFPPLIVQLVKTGETSGLLDTMLNKAAAFLEAEVNQTIERSCQLLEPLIMVVLGVLIGGLVIGMYLPIFNLGNTL